MVLTLQKRVVTGICAIVLLISSSPTHTRQDDTAAHVAAGCAIGAGILGLIGAVSAGIYYLCSKSDEQVLEEARGSLQLAHSYGVRFQNVYTNVFERGYCGEPTLDDIELHFLLPVAMEAAKTGFSVIEYVDALERSVTSLNEALSQVSDRIQKLERDYKTCSSVYESLRLVRSAIRQELAYLEGYSARFSDHKAFFELYAYESKLCGVYAYELEVGRNYQHDLYLFERYIMQSIGTHGLRGDYPLVAYHVRLTDHIERLDRYVNKLRYQYPSRLPLAHQLLGYLRSMRGVIELTPAFKEEKRMKKEAEDRAEWLAYQARQAAALEAHARAAQIEAEAQRALVRLERERNRIEREKYHIAPVANATVSMTLNI